MSTGLEEIFQNLRGSKYTVTSEKNRYYNCIAFAAGETSRWCWPQISAYWPDNVPRDETIQSFILAFSTLGYSPCEDGVLEAGFEKVVIYADENMTPTHMARQLPNGAWISKCGKLEDIEHDTLEALEGSAPGGYGTVIQFLKRSFEQPAETTG